jgi:hypothetical protein
MYVDVSADMLRTTRKDSFFWKHTLTAKTRVFGLQLMPTPAKPYVVYIYKQREQNCLHLPVHNYLYSVLKTSMHTFFTLGSHLHIEVSRKASVSRKTTNYCQMHERIRWTPPNSFGKFS